MTKYGWRDGVVSSKKLVVQDLMPVQYIIPKTAAYATGAILTGHNFNGASTALTNVALALQPPYPANIVLVANAVGTAGHNDVITITGEDQFGDYVTENLYIKATAAATTAGAKAFGKIDGVSVYSGHTSSSTTVKSTSIGLCWNNIVGLPWPIANNDDIVSYAYDGSYATTAVDDLTISVTNNTLTLPTMAAGKVVSVIYKSKLQK